MFWILNIPKIPEHLILPLEETLELENIFEGDSDNYTIHNVQKELKEYLQPLFPNYSLFRYQTMINEIPVHVDGSRDFAINYIIDPGGDNVHTVWYEEDRITSTQDVKFPAQQWHEIQVNLYHNVTGITGRRYGITIAHRTIDNKIDARNMNWNRWNQGQIR